MTAHRGGEVGELAGLPVEFARELLQSCVDGTARVSEVAHQVARTLTEAEAQAGQNLARVAESLDATNQALQVHTAELASLNQGMNTLLTRMQERHELLGSQAEARERAAMRRAELVKRFLGEDPLANIVRLLLAAGAGGGLAKFLMEGGG